MKKKYNVVIIEDDRIISELLKNKINELASFSVVSTYENPVDFLGFESKFSRSNRQECFYPKRLTL